MMKIKEKYKEILKELKEGKSLTKICDEKNLCRKNVVRMLKKLVLDEYKPLVYGKILCNKNGFDLRLIPNRQTNNNETNLTKEAKKFLAKKYNCFEEVGIWVDNFKKRYTIDLYSVENDLGIEIFWQSDYSFKKILSRMRTYEKYFGNVLCALIKDSSVRSKNRSYILLKEKLRNENIKFIILDISEKHPITETG